MCTGSLPPKVNGSISCRPSCPHFFQKSSSLRLPRSLALPGFPFLNRRHRRPSSYYHLSFHRITLPAIFFLPQFFFLVFFFSPLPFFHLSLFSPPFFLFFFYFNFLFRGSFPARVLCTNALVRVGSWQLGRRYLVNR